MSRIEFELEGIELGDGRLNRRSESILRRLSEGADKSLKGAFEGWGETKAAYRFLDNDSVDPAKIIAPHIGKTRRRFDFSEVILCVQDTTILNDSSRKKKVSGVGKIRHEEEQGLILYPLYSFLLAPLGKIEY